LLTKGFDADFKRRAHDVVRDLVKDIVLPDSSDEPCESTAEEPPAKRRRADLAGLISCWVVSATRLWIARHPSLISICRPRVALEMTRIQHLRGGVATRKRFQSAHVWPRNILPYRPLPCNLSTCFQRLVT